MDKNICFEIGTEKINNDLTGSETFHNVLPSAYMCIDIHMKSTDQNNIIFTQCKYMQMQDIVQRPSEYYNKTKTPPVKTSHLDFPLFQPAYPTRSCKSANQKVLLADQQTAFVIKCYMCIILKFDRNTVMFSASQVKNLCSTTFKDLESVLSPITCGNVLNTVIYVLTLS